MTVQDEAGASIPCPSVIQERIRAAQPERLIPSVLQEVGRLADLDRLAPEDLAELAQVGVEYLDLVCSRLGESCNDPILAKALGAASSCHRPSARPLAQLTAVQGLLWHVTWMFMRGPESTLRSLGKSLFFLTIAIRLADSRALGVGSWKEDLVAATYRCFRQLYHNPAVSRHVHVSASALVDEPRALQALALSIESAAMARSPGAGAV